MDAARCHRPHAQHRHQPRARRRRRRSQRAASIRKIAGGSLLPADRGEARVMIATIKSEWRKLRFRPAFFVSSGLIAGITLLVYSLNWYQPLNPGARDRRGFVSILTLSPAPF